MPILGSTTNIRQQSHQYLHICPVTYQRLKRDNGIQLHILGRLVIWWQCSACEGWHVSVEVLEPESEERII